MSKGVVALPVTGVLLHSRPYKEHHYFCTLLTAECGRVDCVFANATPEFYREFQAKLSSRHGLGNISDFRYTQPVRLTKTELYFLGLYLNELLYWLAPRNVDASRLYGVYLATLVQLEHGENITQALRFFEQSLLQEIGQAIDFYRDVDNFPIAPQQLYRYKAGQGFLIDPQGRYTGEQILAAAELNKGVSGALTLARECLGAQLDFALNFRPLQSRLWLKAITQSG